MKTKFKALSCTLGIVLSVLALLLVTVLFPSTIFWIFGATTVMLIYTLYQFIYTHMEWEERDQKKAKDDE